MTAKVLVVDDIAANVKLLEARLAAEYFETLAANSGQEALEICAEQRPDVVLLDVMMPGMDGFEVCRRLKDDPLTRHIPVVMVTALDQPADKIQGLEAGADDFLTKPVDDLALISRVKNLARLKMLNDELVMRAETGQKMGISKEVDQEWSHAGVGGRVLLVDDHERSAGRIGATVSLDHVCEVEANPHAAVTRLTEEDFDLLIVSLSLSNSDGLRLCSQVRSMESSRHLPIIMLVEPGDQKKMMMGLEMGVNDYLVRPLDRHEMLARVRTQIKRKRFSDFLKSRFEQNMEMAVTDSLTKLYNRRYMETHLVTLVRDAIASGKDLSLCVTDIDFFKSVNDTHGHDVGDLVLVEFADRLRLNTRGIDLACRMGGEEFVIIMPETNMASALHVGERLRSCVADDPFTVGLTSPLPITTSVGVATLESLEDTPLSLLRRADQALYAAKKEGRNRVVADAA